ncbi:MAG: hypothetical protein K9G33_14955 [Sneathiella sp.]|nr:hypothetical protein [Sneathiella sp.]
MSETETLDILTVGSMFKWVQKQFEPLTSKAILGDEYGSGLASIQYNLENLQQILNNTPDSVLEQNYDLPPWQIRLDCQQAVGEFMRNEAQLRGFYKQAIAQKERDNNRLEANRAALHQSSLQYSKYILIGYGAGIFTVLSAMVANTTKTELMVPLQHSLWVLLFGLCATFLSRLCLALLFGLTILWGQIRVDMQKKKITKLDRKLILIWIIPLLLMLLFMLFSLVVGFISIAALPAALIVFLYYDQQSVMTFHNLLQLVGL